MRQINQEDKADQEEEDGANQSNIIAPEDEEAVGNEEGNDDETNPGRQFRTPETILNCGSLIPGAVDANEEQRQDEVQEAQGEVDAVDGGVAIAVFAHTANGGKVQQHLLQLLNSPVGEQNPRKKGIEQ